MARESTSAGEKAPKKVKPIYSYPRAPVLQWKWKKSIQKKAVAKNVLLMLFATTIANALSFIFQLYMGRSLGKEGYGVLGSLSSILYIALIFAGTVQTAIAKSVTIYKFDGAIGKVASVSAKSIYAMLVWGAGAVLLLWIFSPQIAGFLNIENTGGSA